jgi:hypothetical protein
MSFAVAEFAPYDWLVAFTVAVSAMAVPLAVPALTLYLTVNIPDTPAPTLGFVQGDAGNPAQVQPAGGVTETNVMFPAGVIVSLNEPFVMADVPVFVTTCV